jgi:hypothetical protein
LVWCEDHGLTITSIRPFYVAAWVKRLQEKHGAPCVKQQLAAVRMMFDWLVTGQIVPINPAAAVRAPKHAVKVGKMPMPARANGSRRMWWRGSDCEHKKMSAPPHVYGHCDAGER